MLSHSKKVSRSISSQDLLGNSSPRLSHSERIVPGCISSGNSLEDVQVPVSVNLPHSERLVPGGLSTESLQEEIIDQNSVEFKNQN